MSDTDMLYIGGLEIKVEKLKKILQESNKEKDTYYKALKNIVELCSKNSCTANEEYLSDIISDIEGVVKNALSDSPKACKTKD